MKDHNDNTSSKKESAAPAPAEDVDMVSDHNLASSGTDALVTSTAEDEEPPEEHEPLETEFDYSVPTQAGLTG